MSQQSPAAERPAVSGIWILDSWKDFVFFVGTPLLIIPMVALAQLRFSAESIGLAVATFGAQGHHLPGMLRAYGDRQLFRRYRVRFIVAPIFLLVVCGLFAHLHLDGLLVVVLLWGFWHGLAQVYGFMRIYDAKLGAKSHMRARLDLAMCIVWFVGGLLYSPEKIAHLVEVSYKFGSPFLASSTFHDIRSGWSVVTALVTVGFLVYTFVTWRQGQLCSVVKLLVMASSFSFWWFAMVYLRPIILGVAAFEIFHDVQYLTIVWVYNRTRVKTGRPVGAFTRFLFRKNTMLIALYVGLVFAYGYLGLLNRMISNEDLKLTLYGFVTASALLHYYYDGFIWKIREPTTSEALGMQSQDLKGSKLPARPLPTQGWFVHGLKWSAFVVPAVWLFTTQLHSQTMTLEQRQAVVALVPDSADAHVGLADALRDQKHFDEAVAEYQEALRLNPNVAEVHLNSGSALQGLKRFGEATAQYQEALRLEPTLAEAHFGWGNALLGQGRFEDAVAQYQETLRLEPTRAEPHFGWGNALQGRGHFEEAVAQYQEALRLKPDYAEAHLNWGSALQNQQHFAEAVAQYQEALRLKPNYAEAHYNWGAAMRGLGHLDEAAAQYEEALRLNPNLRANGN